jgi:hypothetical protein
LSCGFYRVAFVLLGLCACLRAAAQGTGQANTPAPPDPAHLEQVPRVPGVSTLLRGLNAGVTFSAVHDSSIGWYTVATPAVSFTFSPHYSADASISVYPSRLVQNRDLGTLRTQQLVLAFGDLGDTVIGLHARFNSRMVHNTTTASFTLPTGDDAEGLGAGKATFDFSDHMEHYFGKTGLLLDFGAGNSSGLFNRLVTNDYTSLGALAHFQQGVVFWLFGRNYVQSVAYEQFPIGNQTVFTGPGPPGFPGLTVVFGNGLGHDNGVTTSLGIPIGANLTLSSYYNRSFEQNLDTVSTGITYVLRGRPELRRLSMIDRALREAERANRQQH